MLRPDLFPRERERDGRQPKGQNSSYFARPFSGLLARPRALAMHNAFDARVYVYTR